MCASPAGASVKWRGGQGVVGWSVCPVAGQNTPKPDVLLQAARTDDFKGQPLRAKRYHKLTLILHSLVVPVGTARKP